jgi:hypothetical protein
MHLSPLSRLAALAALVLCALSALGQSPAIWGEVSAPIVRSDRWLWMGSGEIRTDEPLPRPLFIGRGATSIRYKLPKGWSLRAGYWGVVRGRGLVSVGWQHNVSGGVSYPLLWTAQAGVGTTIYEHQFFPGGAPDRDRLRQRFEFNWDTGKVSPWAYEELTFTNRIGFFRSRSRLGVAFSLPRSFELRTGYQFQSIKDSTGAWGPRHAILLQLRLPTFVDLRTKKKKVPEPQPEQQLEDLQSH